jgi:NADPH2:quinone reductase
MKAIYLVRNGAPEKAFEFRDITPANPGAEEVSIEVEASGLNFADVVARLGNYQDCPPLPTVVGYEVVGRVRAIGSKVTSVSIGQRVLAFTRFGGYSQWVVQQALAVAPIPEDMNAGVALALATQYCTAYYASHIAAQVFPGEKVLIQSAAGGVGTALVQLCKLRGAYIYGTAGSPKKIEYLKSLGVDVPINYNTQDFSEVIKEPIDVAFDAVGGETFRKSYKLLNRGGRMIGYGASSFTDATNIFSKAKGGLAFGIYHPAQLMMESRSMIGVNMLRIGDYRPDLLQKCLEDVIQLASDKKLVPHVGAMYPATEIAKAHRELESRKTIGKTGIVW